MFLTEDDIPIYAPTVTLIDDALIGAIAVAQSICESPMAAGRSLEIQEITETLSLNEFQSCFLTHSPILAIVNVEARTGNFKDSTGAPYQASPWRIIPEENYTIDQNELTVVGTDGLSTGWPRINRIRYTDARITYSTGYNPEEDTVDTRYIKSHLGQVLTYLQGANYQGVKSLKVPFREFEIQYSDSLPATIPESLLTPFWRFQPITYSVE
jgi:hypothetical protein